ncbi:TPA: hypothetical protein DEG21_01130 [Patescibacteria group bacterium]|nr:hypothetical protein [Candidatus Gracilibacteria bacterium]HBY74506.1 hypothetical protein [Candidatus Gracilibacteria bacterium]
MLSTIHTNSAAETITRILNMGIQAFLLPASINAIIAQRLVRKLCSCKKEIGADKLDPKMQETIKKAMLRIKKDELMSRVGMEKLKNPIFYEPA